MTNKSRHHCNRYIEWLALFDFVAQNGGILALFDLDGDAAMETSPNCAMELGLLYQLFGVDIPLTRQIRRRVQLVVLKDEDVGDGSNEGLIAAAIALKLKDPKEQSELFKVAYDKCKPVLEEAQGVQLLGRWIEDFVQVAKHQGNDVSYLEDAFFRLLDNDQLAVWAEDPRNWNREEIKVSYNDNLTGKCAHQQYYSLHFAVTRMLNFRIHRTPRPV